MKGVEAVNEFRLMSGLEPPFGVQLFRFLTILGLPGILYGGFLLGAEIDSEVEFLSLILGTLFCVVGVAYALAVYRWAVKNPRKMRAWYTVPVALGYVFSIYLVAEGSYGSTEILSDGLSVLWLAYFWVSGKFKRWISCIEQQDNTTCEEEIA